MFCFVIENERIFVVFFFQAEDGIRDADVTGVQTCALPICAPALATASAVRSNWRSDSTAQGPAITTKSSPPISTLPARTTLRTQSSVFVLATRSKRENWPFRSGFMNCEAQFYEAAGD